LVFKQVQVNTESFIFICKISKNSLKKYIVLNRVRNRTLERMKTKEDTVFFQK